MKKFLLGTVALAALGASANAADMRARPYVAAVVPYTTWTGCHVGGSVGTEWGRNSGYNATGASRGATNIGVDLGAIPAGTPVVSGFSMDGFNGGFYAGCDYQVGAWVFGIEGDWLTVNKEGQAFFNPGVTTTGGATFLTSNIISAKERWFATARGRLGYSVDKWLFYVTGGAAWMKIDSEYTASAAGGVLVPNAAAFQSDRRTGWTVGAGLDYALSYGWSIRSEYLFIAIPSYTTFTNPTLGGATAFGFPTNLETRLYNHVWRSGLTYKFGYDPVVAAVTK